jgi:hypothetical protein
MLRRAVDDGGRGYGTERRGRRIEKSPAITKVAAAAAGSHNKSATAQTRVKEEEEVEHGRDRV